MQREDQITAFVDLEDERLVLALTARKPNDARQRNGRFMDLERFLIELVDVLVGNHLQGVS